MGIIRPSNISDEFSADDVKEDVDLDQDRKIHKKQESSITHWIKIIFLVVVALLGTVLLIIYFLHLVLPDHCLWLSEVRLSNLRGQAISIVSGVAVGLAICWTTK